MKIFLLNLDKDKDRLAFAEKQSIKYNYKFERIPAINGKLLSKKDIKSIINKFIFLCSLGRKPLDGEIGCALSHLHIYEKMVRENIPYVCILEDDVFVFETFKERLCLLEKFFDKNKAQVVRLNFSVSPGTINNSTTVKWGGGITRSYSGYSACSYCLNLQAAKALLFINKPLISVSDNWKAWTKHNFIELYDIDKKVCWHNNDQSGFDSVINPSYNKNNPSRIKIILNKPLRLIEKFIFNLFVRVKIYKYKR